MKESRKRLLAAYVVALHAALAVTLPSSGLVERVKRRLGHLTTMQAQTLERHDVWSALTPQGATVFLGDSLMENLPAADVAPLAVNLGISGIQTHDLLANLPHYKVALQNAGRVYILIGTNDVLRGKFEGVPEDVERIVQHVPAGTAVLLSAIPPSLREYDRPRLHRLNADLKTLCGKRAGCQFLDPWGEFFNADGVLDGALFKPDGLHFSAEGYRRWVGLLRAAA